MFIVLALIWICSFLLWYFLSRRQLVILGSKLPGPPGYPIIGNALMFYGKPEKVFKDLHAISMDYTRLAAIWIGPQLQVAIYDPKDVEIIMKASKFMEKAAEYKFLRPWLGESILISEGAKFKHHKKLITPAFQIQNLKQYLQVFSEHSKLLIETMEEQLDQKEEFDVHPYLSLTTMFILLETSMGVKKETLGTDALDYSKAVERLGRFAHMRVYKVWLRPEITFKFSRLKREQDKYLNIIHPLTERVIRERKKEYEARKEQEIETGESSDKGWPIFMDKLLGAQDEFGFGLNEQEIKDEVMTLMFAGQDTTTVSMGFVLSILGVHPEIQDKVVKELDEVFANSNRTVTYEDTKKMVYMEQVIQETWRLYPPIPLIAKRPTENLQLDGYLLPKNCTLAIVIMIVHRNPKEYPNPNRFDPDNFLPERIKERNPYSFIPFSAGSRICIGQRYAMLLIKVMLSYILRNYNVQAKTARKDFILAAQTTLKRRDGFKISIKRRIKSSESGTIIN